MKIIQLFAFLAIMLFSLNAIAQEYRTSDNGQWRMIKIYKPKYSKGNYDIIGLKDEMVSFLKQCVFVSDISVEIAKRKSCDVKVFDNRFEITSYNRNHVVLNTSIINFIDLLSGSIYLEQIEYSTGGPSLFYPYGLAIEGAAWIRFQDLEQAKKMTFYFFCLQYLLNEELNKKHLSEFESIAAGYRALKEKPEVSEEQRKYIVQANTFMQKKDYNKALELTRKALTINNLAYTTGYSNLAILYALFDSYQTAIFYMKKYIMLEPEAARDAQDKIYEWEANIIE